MASDLPLGLRRPLRPGQYLTAKTETEDSVEELLAPRGGQPDRGPDRTAGVSAESYRVVSHGCPSTSVTDFKGRGLGKNSPPPHERETQMLVQGREAGNCVCTTHSPLRALPPPHPKTTRFTDTLCFRSSSEWGEEEATSSQVDCIQSEQICHLTTEVSLFTFHFR